MNMSITRVDSHTCIRDQDAEAVQADLDKYATKWIAGSDENELHNFLHKQNGFFERFSGDCDRKCWNRYNFLGGKEMDCNE